MANMFSQKKTSQPVFQGVPTEDPIPLNSAHSVSFPDHVTMKNEATEEEHLSARDREDMERILSPGHRFDDLVHLGDTNPEIFVPADSHHYDEMDYRNHRHTVYPHMHQPLKSMEPRALRKIKARIRVAKKVERQASHPPYPTPSVIISMEADEPTEAQPSSHDVQDSLLPAPEHPPVIPKKKKRRRHRSKRHEPFLPTLTHLSEESAGTPPSPEVSTDDDEEECEDISERPLDTLPHAAEQYSHLSTASNADLFDPARRPSVPQSLPLTASTPTTLPLSPSQPSLSTLSSSSGVTLSPTAPQLTFLEEMNIGQHENRFLPISFLDITQTRLDCKKHALGWAESNRLRNRSLNASLPALTANSNVSTPIPTIVEPQVAALRSLKPGQLGSGRKISFADQVPAITEMDAGDRTPGSMKRKASFHLGGELNFGSSNSPSLPPATTHLAPEPLHPCPPVEEDDHHRLHIGRSSRHHRENYSERDLRHRTCSGIDLVRHMNPVLVTEADEANSLGVADLQTIYDHRFEDLKGLCRSRISRQANASSPQFNLQNRSSNNMPEAPLDQNDRLRVLACTSFSGPFHDHHIAKPVFVQMDVLTFNDRYQKLEWKEKSRWIRFEEDVCESADRFNPPFLPPLKFHAMILFRRYLEESTIILDAPCDSVESIATTVGCRLIATKHCTPEEASCVESVLHLPHIFVGAKTHWKNLMTQSHSFEGEEAQHLIGAGSFNGSPTYNEGTMNVNNKRGTAPANMHLVGQQCKSQTGFGVSPDDIKTSEFRTSNMTNALGLPGFLRLRSNTHQSTYPFISEMSTRLKGRHYESVSVQVGQLEFLSQPIMVCLRLNEPRKYVGHKLTEVEEEAPLRFILIFLGPDMDGQVDYAEIGRVFATMMTDQKFCETTYSATSKEDFLEGLRVFLDASLVMPLFEETTAKSLGGMQAQLRAYTRSAKVEFQHIQRRRAQTPDREKSQEDQLYANPSLLRSSTPGSHLSLGMPYDQESKHEPTLRPRDWLCPPFSSLSRDLIGYKMRVLSDFRDAFIPDNLPTILLGIFFVYFTVLAPALTFGALMSKYVSQEFTITLCLVACGCLQFVFAIFGGQPLIIVGITGPIFIIEEALANICRTMDNTDLFIVRFWIAIYTACVGLLVIGCNLVIVVQFIRRSVEEVFNCFIGIYFIFKAIVSMFELMYDKSGVPVVINSNLTDSSSPPSTSHLKRSQAAATFFLAFFMLAVSLALVSIRRGQYFTRKIRSFFGSFNVPLGILLVVLLNLTVFPDFQLTTLSVRSNSSSNSLGSLFRFPDYSSLIAKSTPQVHGFALLVGICLSILICTETIIAGVTVAKAERKLKKPCLFTLDFLLCLVILPLISGCLGWPFVTGAVVRSCSHVIAMTKWDMKTVPGVAHKIIGCAEQRFSGAIVGVLVALSITLHLVLGYIPIAAMYGMFLYMGVMGLRDLQFVRRFMALLQRRKHWPEADYLRNFPYRHVMALGCIQGLAIGTLVLCNCITQFAKIPYTSFALPVVLLIYALIREFLLPRCAWINRHLEEMDTRHKIVLLSFATTKASSHGNISRPPTLLELENINSKSNLQIVLPAVVDPNELSYVDAEDSAWERHVENPYPHGR